MTEEAGYSESHIQMIFSQRKIEEVLQTLKTLMYIVYFFLLKGPDDGFRDSSEAFRRPQLLLKPFE